MKLIPVCKSNYGLLWIIQTNVQRCESSNRQDGSYHYRNHNYIAQIVSESPRMDFKSLTYKFLYGSSGSYTTNAPRRPSQYWVSTQKVIFIPGYERASSKLTMMWVVPKGSGLIWDRELIQKRISRDNWALRDSNRTIRIIGLFLENSVPML